MSYLKKISIDSIKETLFTLNHDFDLWLGESDVNELIEPMIKSLEKDGKIVLDDNALVSAQDTDPKILIAKDTYKMGYGLMKKTSEKGIIRLVKVAAGVEQ